VTAFKVLPGLKVVPSDQLIRACGDRTINNSQYTFFYVRDAETKTFPERYRMPKRAQRTP
jgi:hypothetical protein